MCLCWSTVFTLTGKSVSSTSVNEGCYLQIPFLTVLGAVGQDLLGTEQNLQLCSLLVMGQVGSWRSLGSRLLYGDGRAWRPGTCNLGLIASLCLCFPSHLPCPVVSKC